MHRSAGRRLLGYPAERPLRRTGDPGDLSQLDFVRDDGSVGDRAADKEAGYASPVSRPGVSPSTNILRSGRSGSTLFDFAEFASGIRDRIGPDYRWIAVLFLLEKAAGSQIVKDGRGFPDEKNALGGSVLKRGKIFAFLF